MTIDLRPSQQTRRKALVFAAILVAAYLSISFLPPRVLTLGFAPLATAHAAQDATHPLSPISIDYPQNGSIFPPGITPPTFLWRDAAGTSWAIDISFPDNSAPIHVATQGERMKLGAIDPDTVADSNRPPALTLQQAATWTWTPDAATWAAIQSHTVKKPATLSITGYRDKQVAWSQSRIQFTTSQDPVGAPIFYRDVPLMPSAGVNGVVSPLAPTAIPLVHWRLRDITKPESHTVLKNMPTCGNCHSFSADGKTFGMDIDGPANNKGLYAVVPVQKHMTIDSKDMVSWNPAGQIGTTRVGFMSQVSPDGRYVLSTFAGPDLKLQDSYYVTNFMDYRFLQVFFPTRGILAWYDRKTGLRTPLPGADDPKYVQTDGVWSPDGKYIVFARAESRPPREKGQPPALHALDSTETQIQYDLYRIPFNDGKGGVAQRIEGASANGMSNNFPKISPDNKWIVFVQCKNGQLMRPDSQLYMVPSGGGAARRMNANTSLMNSWHSFSPNGRWLVFSSKARSPYTQMYLTHIDANGNDSPAILIDNATAANRAVNIPEFANIAGDGIEDIAVHVADSPKAPEPPKAAETPKAADSAKGGNALK